MMNQKRQHKPFMQEVFKKSFLAFPFLLLVFLFYGIKHEHNDLNTGLMYPLVFAVHLIIVSVVSYILYFMVDRNALNPRLNFTKNFVHLILAIGLLWSYDNVILLLVLLALPTLLVINLASSFYGFYIKTKRIATALFSRFINKE